MRDNKSEKKWLRQFINPKTFSFVGIGFILLTIPIIIFYNQQQHVYNQHAAGNAHTYYVSKNGNNADGLSWQTAWNELKQINWSVIQPGDTILLDGGSSSMTYITTLTIGKSGTQAAPITIQKASDAGRNGHVIIFGGRSTLLPYCNQPNYVGQTTGINSSGIDMGFSLWVIIDGMNWNGITIHGAGQQGVSFSSSSSNDTIRNLETYDNGGFSQSGGTASPVSSGGGVLIYGSNHLFEQVHIHDDGAGAFQPSGNNITINKSWLHITREDPTQPGTPFNQCIHQDGYQIWHSGIHAGITIKNSIISGEKEGTILGDTGQGAVVNNVTITNTLFLGKVINIMGGGHAGTVKEQNWIIDHDTVYGTDPNNTVEIWLDGAPLTVTNSIFYNGHVWLADGLTTSYNNCQWHTNADNAKIQGQTVDPQFTTNVSGFTSATPLVTIENADFSLKPSSPCKGVGSSITSVAQFLQMVMNGQPTPTNSPAPSSTPIPTPTPTPANNSAKHYEYVLPDGNIYVYDMDNNHQLVKQVSLPTSSGTRGVVGYAPNHMLYISYGSDGNSGGSLLAYDLLTDKVVWAKSYPFGIDSHSITPDGKFIYMPDGELSSSPYWYVINASDGSTTGAKINGGPGPHNTIVSLNGQHVYMGARNFGNNPTNLTVADTATNSNVRNIGPFKEGVRPFTINSAETLAYVTTTGFLGFQVADIQSGKVIYTIDLTQLGFPNSPTGPTAPSHGISLSPDEKTIAVVDWPNDYVHLFDVTKVPSSAPVKIADIKFTRSMHHTESPCAYDCAADGWLEYSRDGRFLYVGDVGDVINTSTNKVVTNIGTLYNTRKMIEVDFQNGAVSYVPINRASVGFGGVTSSPTPIPTVTPTQGVNPTVSPTPNPNTAIISLTIGLHGIGTAGDNENPNGPGNTNLKHSTRSISVVAFDLSNVQKAQQTGQIPFDSTSGLFKGTIDLGNVQTGDYQLKFQTNGFLVKRLPFIVHITSGQTTQIPQFSFINGDINNDNQLDILDYNILIGCFGSKQNTSSCTSPPTTQSAGADIDDDGTVDGADYNLFLRELSVQKGG